MASITWTNTAQSNLIEIREYIALDSALQADLTIDAIYTKAQVLERFPEIGKKVKELPGKEYKEILYKKYRIIYKLHNENVFIMSVYHSSRLLQNNPTFKNDF